MKNYIKLVATIGLTSAFLNGCAVSTATFAPDGRPAFSIDCSGAALNWGRCEEKAGDICQSKGYDIISRQGENVGNMSNASGYANSRSSITGRPGDYSGIASAQTNYLSIPIVNRNMLVACKK